MLKKRLKETKRRAKTANRHMHLMDTFTITSQRRIDICNKVIELGFDDLLEDIHTTRVGLDRNSSEQLGAFCLPIAQLPSPSCLADVRNT